MAFMVPGVLNLLFSFLAVAGLWVSAAKAESSIRGRVLLFSFCKWVAYWWVTRFFHRLLHFLPVCDPLKGITAMSP
jgi:hypothetical protein